MNSYTEILTKFMSSYERRDVALFWGGGGVRMYEIVRPWEGGGWRWVIIPSRGWVVLSEVENGCVTVLF